MWGEVKYKLRALDILVTYVKAMLIYVGLCGRSSHWFRAVSALVIVERHARAYVEGDALPQSVRTTVRLMLDAPPFFHVRSLVPILQVFLLSYPAPTLAVPTPPYPKTVGLRLEFSLPWVS